MSLLIAGAALIAVLMQFPDDRQEVEICDLNTGVCELRYIEVNRDQYGNWIVP